jgi:ADP-heptose:LPS heptosyltransferase
MPTLVYHTGALGDFITILPALSVWRNDHPNEPLTLMGRPEIGSFALETGCIDAFIDVTLARFAPLFNPDPSAETAEILAPYSHAIIFSAGDSSLIAHCRKSGISVYEQPPFPLNRVHVVDYHISLFKDPQAVPMHKRMPRILVPQSSLQASFPLVGAREKFCILHAGSGSVNKNWPFDRFEYVADRLRKQGKNIVWIRGPAESAMRFPDVDRIVENQTLSVLAAILQRAELFLGNDSGVAHLAAAVGCPSLVMFGPSDPQVWSPRGDRVRIVFSKKVSCSPCHFPQDVPRECDRQCLTDLTVEEVFSLLS